MLPRIQVVLVASLCSCFLFHKAVAVKCPVGSLLVTPSSRLDTSQPKACEDFCCQDNTGVAQVYCCSDCKLSTDSTDCDEQNYWRYVGYAVGSVAFICVLVGLGCVAAKLVKRLCCKKRSGRITALTSNATAGDAIGQSRTGRRSQRDDGGNSPSLEPPPPPPPLPPTGWADQLPKKPPEYYEIFSSQPPPPYAESAV